MRDRGRFSGALASYQSALALLQAAEKSKATSARARDDLRIVHLRLSDVLWVIGDVRGSLAYDEIAYADIRAQLSARPDDAQSRFMAALLAMDYGYKLFRMSGDYAAAQAHMREAIAHLEALMRSRATVPVRRLLAVSYTKTSELLVHNKEFAEALDMNLKSMQLFEGLLASSPDRFGLSGEPRGCPALRGGRANESRAARGSAQARAGVCSAIVESLHAAEPGVSEFHGFVGMAHTALAEIVEREGRPEAAIPLLREALDELNVHRSPRARNTRTSGTGRPRPEAQMGRAFELQGKAEARDWYQRALESFRQVQPIWSEAGEDAARMTEALARVR